MSKIAFCFLLTDTFRHPDIWNKFFKGHESKYSIYSHIKVPESPNIPQYIKDKRIKTIKTAWCDESLITAFLNMIKEGLKDPNNDYFIIVSGDCIPLYDFDSIYKKLFRANRSMMDVVVIKNKYTNIKGDKGQHLYGSQWAIFNRKVAKDFLGIKKQYKNLEFTTEYQHCPDELYPVYYFLNLYGYDFEKNIKIKKINYTEWDKKNTDHPILFDKKHTRSRSKAKSKSNNSKRRRSTTLNKMCTSGALFARKFKTQDIAKKFAMKC